jgi:hypothetical protein
MSITPAFQGEVQFAGYSDSSRSGPRITLRLHDRDELQSFVGMEGKRFMCVLVAIGDDEQPVPPARQPEPSKKLGPLALSAVQFCKNPMFLQWLDVRTEAEAADWIKEKCGVVSRREIDGDPYAPHRFHVAVAKPFSEYMRAMEKGWT